MIGIDQVVQDPDKDLQVAARPEMRFLGFYFLLLKKIFYFSPAQHGSLVIRIDIEKDIFRYLIKTAADVVLLWNKQLPGKWDFLSRFPIPG